MPPIGNPAPRAVHVKATAEPLDFWRAVYLDESQPMERRMRAAIDALPYCHVELKGRAIEGMSAAEIRRLMGMRRGKA